VVELNYTKITYTTAKNVGLCRPIHNTDKQV